MHSKHECPDTCCIGHAKPTLDTSSALRTHCSTVTALALQLFPEVQIDWTHLQWKSMAWLLIRLDIKDCRSLHEEEQGMACILWVI